MNLKKTIKFTIFFIGVFFTQLIIAQGFEIPKKPDFQTSVYDYVGLLSASQKKGLEKKLIKYSDSTSTQIVVAIIKSTEGENIAYLGAKWLTKWGIGDKKKDNGILITLARDDRKININTGYGVEHLLTDFMSRRIIERDIIPHFKNGDYYAGLNSGSTAVFKVLNGEYKGSRKGKSEDGLGFGFIIFIVILIVFFILVSRGNRGNRGGGRSYRNGGSRNILETIILSNAGRGGFGGGGFGGGSSGGFGDGGGFGGGFGGGMGGGGGATGSW